MCTIQRATDCNASPPAIAKAQVLAQVNKCYLVVMNIVQLQDKKHQATGAVRELTARQASTVNHTHNHSSTSALPDEPLPTAAPRRTPTPPAAQATTPLAINAAEESAAAAPRSNVGGAAVPGRNQVRAADGAAQLTRQAASGDVKRRKLVSNIGVTALPEVATAASGPAPHSFSKHESAPEPPAVGLASLFAPVRASSLSHASGRFTSGLRASSSALQDVKMEPRPAAQEAAHGAPVSNPAHAPAVDSAAPVVPALDVASAAQELPTSELEPAEPTAKLEAAAEASVAAGAPASAAAPAAPRRPLKRQRAPEAANVAATGDTTPRTAEPSQRATPGSARSAPGADTTAALAAKPERGTPGTARSMRSEDAVAAPTGSSARGRAALNGGHAADDARARNIGLQRGHRRGTTPPPRSHPASSTSPASPTPRRGSASCERSHSMDAHGDPAHATRHAADMPLRRGTDVATAGVYRRGTDPPQRSAGGGSGDRGHRFAWQGDRGRSSSQDRSQERGDVGAGGRTRGMRGGVKRRRARKHHGSWDAPLPLQSQGSGGSAGGAARGYRGAEGGAEELPLPPPPPVGVSARHRTSGAVGEERFPSSAGAHYLPPPPQMPSRHRSDVPSHNHRAHDHGTPHSPASDRSHRNQELPPPPPRVRLILL